MKGKETIEEVYEDLVKLAPNCYVTRNGNNIRAKALNTAGHKEVYKLAAYCENDDLNHYDLDVDLDRWVWTWTFKGQGGGANSLIEAIQGRLLSVDRTEEGKPAGWHTMSCRCEKIIKECYSSFGVKFRDTHDNFCDSPAFYATASPDWVIQYYIEEFKQILKS